MSIPKMNYPQYRKARKLVRKWPNCSFACSTLFCMAATPFLSAARIPLS